MNELRPQYVARWSLPRSFSRRSFSRGSTGTVCRYAMVVCSGQICCRNALTVKLRADQEKFYKLDIEHLQQCARFMDPQCIPRSGDEHEDEVGKCNHTSLIIFEDDPPAFLGHCMRRRPVNAWSTAVTVTCADRSRDEVPGLLSLH